MTVGEMILELEQYDKDMEVGYEYPSHDYWRSVLIGTVDHVEEGYSKWSTYHQTLSVPTEDELTEALDTQDDDPDFPEDKRVERILILR